MDSSYLNIENFNSAYYCWPTSTSLSVKWQIVNDDKKVGWICLFQREEDRKGMKHKLRFFWMVVFQCLTHSQLGWFLSCKVLIQSSIIEQEGFSYGCCYCWLTIKVWISRKGSLFSVINVANKTAPFSNSQSLWMAWSKKKAGKRTWQIGNDFIVTLLNWAIHFWFWTINLYLLISVPYWLGVKIGHKQFKVRQWITCWQSKTNRWTNWFL